MGFPVISYNPSPINSEDHRQFLQTDVMDYLVKTALEESRIDNYYRYIPLGSHSGCKSDGVLFANTHIKDPVRKICGNFTQPAAVSHGSGYGYYFGVNRHDFM
ncbi:MAG: hypothetical protein EGMGGAKC_00256 [Dehalococcoides mccartyi]|nr:hypothetical protein [Dehalococcoides mccartyi]